MLFFSYYKYNKKLLNTGQRLELLIYIKKKKKDVIYNLPNNQFIKQ